MKFNESSNDIAYHDQRKEVLNDVPAEKVAEDFPLFVSRQDLTRYLVRYELFKKILPIKGSIVECGVYKGSSLMLFAQLSSIFEPYAFKRKIIGFDTFEGFPSVDSSKDGMGGIGDLQITNSDFTALENAIKLYDSNRALPHIPKIELVKGEAQETIPLYLTQNPFLVIALLYLDFDLYQPTKIALDNFLPRMPKGSIVAFDELNDASRPGETEAVLETIGISSHRIEKFPEDPHISFITL